MAHHSPFSLYRRKLKSKEPVWYVKLRDPDTGRYSAWRSTGEVRKAAARAQAFKMLKDGQTGATQKGELIPFLEGFWDFNTSAYVKGRLARGGTIGRMYCYTMLSLVKRHVEPYFKGRRLHSLTATDFDSWMAALSDKGVSHRTINYARQAVNVALNYLVSLRRLPWNPVLPAKPYKEIHARRGIFTVKEYRALLTLPDLDPRQLIAIALGGLAGLRLGEIRGLRWEDVDQENGIIHVHTSYVEMDNERDQAKHGSNRDALLSSPIIRALEAWMALSPAKAPHDFIICQLDHFERPMPSDTLRYQFYTALKRIGISEDTRAERALCFHSLRHWFNSQLRGAIPDHVLRGLTGHKNAEMTELYSHANPIDFEKARQRLDDLLKPREETIPVGRP